MAFQPLNSRQMINSSALSTSIGSAAGSTVSSILAQIDSVMVNLGSPQALTNKTIGLTTSGLLANTLQFQEIATPATNPAVNTVALYPKSDGHFYCLNSAGVEVQVGSAGAGAIGSVQSAFCTVAQFQAQEGVGWILADGSAVPGSSFEALGILGGSTLTASSNATSTTASVPITFSTPVLTTTANTNGNNQLSNIASLTGLAVGQLISGTAIPPLTTVSSISQYIFALPGTPAQYTFTVHSSTKYVFTVTSATATAGSTYTNNGNTYTVSTTVSGATTLNATGTADPNPSGTLTLASGSGDATITFTSFTYQGANANAGATYTNNGNTYTVSSTATNSTTLVSTGTGDPNPSGTLTLSGGTGDATITFTSFIFGAHNAVAGAVYSNNGQTFTVQVSIDDGLPLICTGTGIPQSSGTLTLVSGVGDSTIPFNSVSGTVTMSAAATSTAGLSVIFSDAPVTTNGTLTSGSPTITALTNTTGIVDGQIISVNGMSPYATVSAVNTASVPDLRGLVLRGKNNGRSDGNQDPAGDLALGTFEHDTTAVNGLHDQGHSHVLSTLGNVANNGTTVTAFFGGFSTTTNNGFASLAGDAETRVKAIVLNHFIRIN